MDSYKSYSSQSSLDPLKVCGCGGVCICKELILPVLSSFLSILGSGVSAQFIYTTKDVMLRVDKNVATRCRKACRSVSLYRSNQYRIIFVRHEIKINICVKMIYKAYKFQNIKSGFLECIHIHLRKSRQKRKKKPVFQLHT